MLNELNWHHYKSEGPSKVIMMYCIVHGLVDIPTTHLTPIEQKQSEIVWKKGIYSAS
jgi:hypothetical protein